MVANGIEFLSVLFKPLYSQPKLTRPSRCLVTPSVPGAVVSQHHCVTTRTIRHIKATPISTEDYLRNEISKAIQPQTSDRFTKLVDQSMQLHKHEHSNQREAEKNDMMANTHINIPKAVQPPRHMTAEDR